MSKIDINRIKLYFLTVLTLVAASSVVYAGPGPDLGNISGSTSADSVRIQSIDYLINKADSLSEINSPDLCSISRSIYNNSVAISYQRGIIFGLIYTGVCKFLNDSSTSALSDLKNLITPVEESKDSSLTFDLQYNIGLIYQSMNRRDSALSAFKIAANYSGYSSNKTKTSNLHTKLGLIYWDKGIFDQAIRYFKTALALRESINDSSAIASSLNNLGAVYWKQGDYKNALEKFLKSLLIRNNRHEFDEISISLNNVGLAYQKLQYFDKAEAYFAKAKMLADSADYKFGIAYSNYNLGLLYEDMDSLRLSHEYLRLTSRLCYLYGYRNLQTLTFNHIAENFEKQNDIRKAYKLYSAAADSARKIQDQYALAISYTNLSRIYYKLDKLDSALHFASVSKEIAYSQNMKEILKDNYYQEFEIYSKQQKVLNALESYKDYSELSSELLNENLANNITNMLIKMEIEQTEAENELLLKEKLLTEAELENQRNLRNNIVAVTVLAVISIVALLMLYRVKTNSSSKIEAQNLQLERLNQELNRRNNELRSMVQTRDKLFSIIAHDLRNPLNVIQNYTSLLTETADSLSTSEIKDYTQTINKSGETLAGLIDNLLNWARNQLNQIKMMKTSFPIEPLIEEVLESTTTKLNYKNIQVIREFDAEHSVDGDRNMIELVIRNLITNAVKFSYRNSEISIKVTESGGYCRISIEDSGIGISCEVTDSIFMDSIASSRGTENETGSGLGLSICREFIEKNHGEINFTSIPGKSTVFWFTLPLNSVTTHRKNSAFQTELS